MKPTIEVRTKKIYTSVMEDKIEEYKVYITEDGEEFSSVISADCHQKMYDRYNEFKNYFSFQKNNLKRGDIGLALKLHKISDAKLIIDYFWIKTINNEEENFLTNFIKHHYDAICFYNEYCIGKWVFVSMESDSKYIWKDG